jgi:signal transduction histidine kinase
MEVQLCDYMTQLESLVEERTLHLRALEKQHAENEKFAAAGRMAARIAHEINNPLSGIKNSFLLIKKAIPSEHQHASYAGRIETEIDRIARIVRQMFDLFRPQQEIHSKFSAREMISDIVCMLQASIQERQVIMEYNPPAEHLFVTLPEGLLRQVIYNIAHNAIEASPPGGKVRIAASIGDQTLQVTITDQGGGIPEQMRSKIFEPFFTTKTGSTTGGLGLGLSISKSIIEALQGSISYDTTIGNGTVFRISLPAHVHHSGEAA